ncbi:MAG: SPFH/Band 7/PHB domain protein, partial [Pseudolysinimonas sp.]
LAEGDANKLWIIPSEFTEALKGVSAGFFPSRDPSVAAAFGAASATVAKAAAAAAAATEAPTATPKPSDS